MGEGAARCESLLFQLQIILMLCTTKENDRGSACDKTKRGGEQLEKLYDNGERTEERIVRSWDCLDGEGALER